METVFRKYLDSREFFPPGRLLSVSSLVDTLLISGTTAGKGGRVFWFLSTVQLSTDKGGERRSRNSLRVRQILQVRNSKFFLTRSREILRTNRCYRRGFFFLRSYLLNCFINRARFRGNKNIRPRSANDISLSRRVCHILRIDRETLRFKNIIPPDKYVTLPCISAYKFIRIVVDAGNFFPNVLSLFFFLFFFTIASIVQRRRKKKKANYRSLPFQRGLLSVYPIRD